MIQRDDSHIDFQTDTSFVKLTEDKIKDDLDKIETELNGKLSVDCKDE